MNMTRSQQSKWSQLVDESKQCLQAIENSRLEIAQRALDACDIIHGGGGHWNDFENQKTLKKFAEDIGINWKTLHGWISILKNVVMKIPETKAKLVSYSTLRETNKLVNSKTNSKKVEKIFDQVAAISKHQTRLRTLIRNISASIHFHKKYGFNDCNTEDFKRLEFQLLAMLELLPNRKAKAG